MMQGLGIFLLGGVLGIGCTYWESKLVKDFDEIKVEKKWSPWVMFFINGILSLLIYQVSDTWLQTFFYVFVVSLFNLLTCFDIKYMLLPTKVIVPGVLLAIGWCLLQFCLTGERYVLMNDLLGGFIGYGLFWVIFFGSKHLLNKEGLGFGDVRLMAFIGLVVGLDQLFLVIIMASFLAVCMGMVLYFMRKQSQAFAFGPFLCGGTMIMLIFGEPILSFYFNWVGL